MKTVGQESDGGTESGSGSDTGNCGGVLPCGTSASGSGSTGSETESGGPENCGTLDNAPDCAAEGCAWQDTSIVSTQGSECEVSEGDGQCFDPGPPSGEDGCVGVLCAADDNQYWTRELDDGTWEFFGGSCFVPAPDGFALCRYDGDDPAACGCACTGTEASLPSGFESTLGASGCADMTVYGASPDGSIGLALSTGPDFNPVADAVATGETTTTTHDVSEFTRLSVLVGTNVTYLECNDAIDKSAFSIDQEWLATAATVEIEVIPEADPPKFDTQGVATVTITGLEVTFGGVTEALDTVSFEDVAVGWLPG